jgi:cytochrome c biogenesis protein CcdA
VVGLALAVVGIALADSLNPSLIVAAVYLALGPHPVRGTLAFSLAALAVTLAGGVVIAVGVGDLILSLVPTPSRTLKYVLITTLGVAIAVGGAVIWWRRDSLADSEPPSRREKAAKGEGSAILLGAGIAGVELLTAFPYFAAIALIVGSSVSTGGKVFLLVLYNVIYVLPLFAIVIVRAAMGDRADKVLATVGDWIAMRWPLVAAPLAAVAGLALTIYGVVQLVDGPG